MMTRISIAGDIGSGKSTIAKAVAARIGVEPLSTGGIQRQLAAARGINTLELNRLAEADPSIDQKIDDYLRALPDGPLVVESRMAWHFVPGTCRVFLYILPAAAAERILGASRSDESYRHMEEAIALLTGAPGQRNQAISEILRCRYQQFEKLRSRYRYDACRRRQGRRGHLRRGKMGPQAHCPGQSGRSRPDARPRRRRGRAPGRRGKIHGGAWLRPRHPDRSPLCRSCLLYRRGTSAGRRGRSKRPRPRPLSDRRVRGRTIRWRSERARTRPSCNCQASHRTSGKSPSASGTSTKSAKNSSAGAVQRRKVGFPRSQSQSRSRIVTAIGHPGASLRSRLCIEF